VASREDEASRMYQRRRILPRAGVLTILHQRNVVADLDDRIRDTRNAILFQRPSIAMIDQRIGLDARDIMMIYVVNSAGTFAAEDHEHTSESKQFHSILR
jgi:hypothetical protein